MLKDKFKDFWKWLKALERGSSTWGDTLLDLLGQVIKSVIIIIIMILIIRIGNRLIERWIKGKVDRSSKEGINPLEKIQLDDKMAMTIGAILKSILRYGVYFVGITAILSVFFGTISITLASVGGVAIGFGAQSLVKDIISGIFILLENQYMVGEVIDVSGMAGTVEAIELRVTKIRGVNGDLFIIPNGSITNIINKSRGDRRVLIEVLVSYQSNIDDAIRVMNKVCQSYAKNKEEIFVEVPEVVGVTNLQSSGVNIRVVGKVKSGEEFKAEVEIRKSIKEALDKEGIEIPYTKVQLLSDLENK